MGHLCTVYLRVELGLYKPYQTKVYQFSSYSILQSYSTPPESDDQMVPTLLLIFLHMLLSGVAGNYHINALSTFVSHDRRNLRSHPISGFISIDCGRELPEDTPDYKDEETDIVYTSDVELIDTGESKKVLTNSDSNPNWKFLENVRSFPFGSKNCYTLKPEQGRDKTYLVRATFMYGNYDTKNSPPVFHLYLGPNLWGNISFDNVTHLVIKEIMHVFPTDFLDICLLNTNKGVPFISSLELRHISNDTIYRSNSELESLETWVRYDYGRDITEPPIRYSEDAYDRIWYPVIWDTDLISINSLLTEDSLSDNDYKPPAMVMRTAITTSSLNDSIGIYWKPPDGQAGYYIYMHFAELKKFNKNREFVIDLNNERWMNRTSPSYLRPLTVFNRASLKGLQLEFRIYATNESTLPPLLNAVEFYKVRKFTQLPTLQHDVEAVINIKKFYTIKKYWQGDPCLPDENYMWDGLNCSYNGDNSPRIIMLNLSSSGIAGVIAEPLSKLSSLQHLDLSYNRLNGTIPEFLSQMPSLKILNLSGNNLSGSVPQVLTEKIKSGTLQLSLDDNPELCLTSLCTKEKKKDKNKKLIVVVAVAVTIPLSLVLLVALAFFWKYNRKRDRGFAVNVSKEVSLKSKDQKFTYTEIRNITNNYATAIGKGGSATVFHGCLRDKTQVAVKILSPSSTQITEFFHTEVQLLMRIHHRNLASLVGYCDEGPNMALIYEYMANGNLEHYLSAEGIPKVLSWKERLHIAVDAAQGLEYLHNGCKPPIIHRDLKSANILLNEKLQAKIGDFGVSRIFATESATHVSTRAIGTNGYVDPEYCRTNKLNERSDVYSFGIVILELITGLPAIIKDTENIPIVTWVNSTLAKGDIHKIVDPRLEGNFNINSAWKILEIAMACVPLTAIQRPSMSDVLMDLRECLATNMKADGRRMESNEADLETDEVAPSPR